MRHWSVALVFLGALPVFAAAVSEHKGHGAQAAAVAAKSGSDAHFADGVIKKVDKAAGKVTIAHGPLPNGMPAMTMVFALGDAALLDSAQPGQKVRFVLQEINGVATIVRMEAVR